MNVDGTRFGGPLPGGIMTCYAANVPNQLSITRLKLYRCPADTGPDLNPDRKGHAVSNYRAVGGRTASRRSHRIRTSAASCSRTAGSA